MTSIADYPEVEGMDGVLLDLSKHVLRLRISDEDQLCREMALYFAARSNLTVLPAEPGDEALAEHEAAAENALTELLQCHNELVAKTEDEYTASALLLEQVPRVFEGYGVSPEAYDALCLKVRTRRAHPSAKVHHAMASLDVLLDRLVALPEAAFSEGTLKTYVEQQQQQQQPLFPPPGDMACSDEPV